MLVALVGMSGSGKDTIVNILEEQHGWSVIRSHTTRDIRDGDREDAYIWSNLKTFQEHTNLECVHEAIVFNGNTYWTLKSDYNHTKQNKIIIVDPIGAATLALKNHAKVVYIHADKNIRIERVGVDRVNRDDNRFDAFPCDFIINNSTGTIIDLVNKFLISVSCL